MSVTQKNSFSEALFHIAVTNPSVKPRGAPALNRTTDELTIFFDEDACIYLVQQKIMGFRGVQKVASNAWRASARKEDRNREPQVGDH